MNDTHAQDAPQKKVKVALYARVSKDETDPTGKSYQEPENQLMPLRQWAQGLGFEVLHEFVDRASGGDSNRPQFQTMLGTCRQHRIDGVLVWALDRFSREGMSNTLKYLQDMKGHGVFLKSFNESWLDTREGGISEVLIAVMAWVAGQERKRISDRTRAALNLKRSGGKVLGRHFLNCACPKHKGRVPELNAPPNP